MELTARISSPLDSVDAGTSKPAKSKKVKEAAIATDTPPDVSGKIQPIPVIDKPLELDIDLGNLLVSDSNEISSLSFRAKPNQYMKKITQENVQLLFNKIWTLPFERVDDVVIAKLPKPSYQLPREKPVPKPKALTKWQAYAKEKGFTKRKKTKLVWDEIVNAYVPRFGYQRAAAQHEKDWVLEVPGNADPYEDQFEKKAEAKTERVAKNELQRLRNIARSRKVDVPSTGLIEKAKPSKTQLQEAMHVAKKATASVGKFQQKLPKEKPMKKTGEKRHFDPLVQRTGVEKSTNLHVLDQVLNKKPKLQLEKVYSKVMQNEAGSDDSPKGGRGGKKAGKGKGKKVKGDFGDAGKKNSRIKKGSARKGSFKKGRASPRSKPKRKSHK